MDLAFPATLYRPNVGLCVTDGAGKVLAGERCFAKVELSSNGLWQMPQGGIEPQEDLMTAAYRELWEETGLTEVDVTHIATHPDWLTYDWPANMSRPDKDMKGQQQRWVLWAYDGPLPDPETTQDHEFTAFDWLTPTDLLARCIDFRHATYEAVFAAFTTEIG